MKNTAATLALIIWVVLFAGAFISFAMTAPEGDGFTRGTNRLATFLSFQGAAILPAIIAFMRAGRYEGTILRFAARLPAVIALSQILGIVGLIVWARVFS